jgi:hypothetical protein
VRANGARTSAALTQASPSKHGILGPLRFDSSQFSETVAEFKPAPDPRRSRACFSNRKLSNKLSTDDWAHAANHQLARQVHQRHVLTL